MIEKDVQKESEEVQQHLANDMKGAKNYLSKSMEPAAVKQEELM